MGGLFSWLAGSSEAPSLVSSSARLPYDLPTFSSADMSAWWAYAGAYAGGLYETYVQLHDSDVALFYVVTCVLALNVALVVCAFVEAPVRQPEGPLTHRGLSRGRTPSSSTRDLKPAVAFRSSGGTTKAFKSLPAMPESKNTWLSPQQTPRSIRAMMPRTNSPRTTPANSSPGALSVAAPATLKLPLSSFSPSSSSSSSSSSFSSGHFRLTLPSTGTGDAEQSLFVLKTFALHKSGKYSAQCTVYLKLPSSVIVMLIEIKALFGTGSSQNAYSCGEVYQKALDTCWKSGISSGVYVVCVDMPMEALSSMQLRVLKQSQDAVPIGYGYLPGDGKSKANLATCITSSGSNRAQSMLASGARDSDTSITFIADSPARRSKHSAMKVRLLDRNTLQLTL
jgi:hypothetical protein